MKKRLVIVLVAVVFLAGVLWILVFRKAGMYTVKQGIPANAVFVVETPSFNSIRDKLYHNKIWSSLKEYPYFEAYHTHLNLADSLCHVYPVLRKWLTDRNFAISCHPLMDGSYDFLYVCDLGKLNVIQLFDGMVGSLLDKGKLRKQGDLTEVALEEMKLYYTIQANLLLISFSPYLVKEGVKACSHQETNQEMQWTSGDVTVLLNHLRLEKWLAGVLGNREMVSDSSLLEKTELVLNLKDKSLNFKGLTYPNRHYFSLLSALNLVNGAKSGVRKIAGEDVAAYVSLCFSSFEELESILLEEYKVNHLKQYTEYEKSLNRLDKFLGVRIAELFTSWIGNEIAVIKPAVDGEKRLDNLVLAIKSKDIDLARDQLGYLVEQIGRKTPVRFREMEYNGHKINYLSLKGFFNLFLGSLFKKFDRPYYTFIGDYVVFSNSSSTLATMIKDYSLGNTLEHHEKCNEVMDQLGNANNIYGYISSPETYEYLYLSLPAETRNEFVKNKGAFQSFESVGFAMVNSGSTYETRIIANHNTDASQEYEVRELSRKLEDFADRIESGYYNVVIPDSIAVSTRGDYAYTGEKLRWAGKLSNGDPEGIWSITDLQGKAVAQYFYREGKPQGETRFFYPDGVVAAQVVYEEGKIKTYKEFFPDGTLKTELEYNRGVRHGEARFYYSTGHLFGEGKYKKGRRTGTWRYYRVTGETDKKLKF